MTGTFFAPTPQKGVGSYQLHRDYCFWLRPRVGTIAKWRALDFLPRLLPQGRKHLGHQLLGLSVARAEATPWYPTLSLFLGSSQRLPQCMAPMPTSPAAPHCVFCALLFAQQKTFPRWSHLTLPNPSTVRGPGWPYWLGYVEAHFSYGDPMPILEPGAGQRTVLSSPLKKRVVTPTGKGV